jgi:hypothetical protein
VVPAPLLLRPVSSSNKLTEGHKASPLGGALLFVSMGGRPSFSIKQRVYGFRLRERTRGLLAMLSWVQISGLTNDANGKAAPLALTPEQIEVYRVALTFVPTGVPVKKYL